MQSPDLHSLTTTSKTMELRGLLVLLLSAAAVCATDSNDDHGGGIRKRPLPLVGNGTCDEPVRDGDLTSVRCLGPVVPMLPGQTIDCNMVLESPYPTDRNVTVIRQSAQMVAQTGKDSWRPVPLSELYLHHVVPNPRFLLGEGAEVRGSKIRKPLPHPYAFIVDGAEAAQYRSRLTNLQLVSTLGVPKESLQETIECWCGHDQLGEESVRGSLFCCKQAPTHATSGVESYQLEYNITFRDVDEREKGIEILGYDASGSRLEYNIPVPTGPNTNNTAAIETVVDKQCPQTGGHSFQIVRCSAHQHVGSICMNVFNLDKDELICSSCPIYGTKPDVPGDELGYVVAIQDADPDYTIEAGTRIRIESVYEGSQKRLGIMGLMGLWVSGLDKSCGNVTAPMAAMAGFKHVAA